MSSYEFSIVLETLIPVLLGVYLTLVATGRVGGSSPKMTEWRKQHAGKLRVLGPLIVLVSLVRAFWLLFLTAR